MRRLSLGFTLVELLVTLVVVGILASLAAPAFDGVFERARADTDTGDLVRALNLARLEAINRGASVYVQPVDNGWNDELVVFVDTNGDGSWAADEDDTIRSIPGMAGGAVVEEDNDAGSVVFNHLGALESPVAGAEFSYARGSHTKTIAVCATGRIQSGACQ
jgi:type IV fimbrial biogenesis protein FimU